MITKRCYFNGITRFAGLVLAITLLLPQLSHATAVGTTPGQFSVDPSGAATYTIPIEVPPGVAGLQPNLSLVYHSRSGNGLLGMGWSLSGLSAITRCPATIVQDGFNGGINFDTNDRFCLDGQRLVANGTDTIPGYATGTKYKTEIETFSKIVASGGTSSNPTYFIVKTKSGLLMEYGYQSNARFYANGPNSSSFYSWALNKVQDTVGNSWSVTYIVDYANGDFRPDYINYTKAAGTGYKRVQFFYEDRSDVETSYMAGSVFIKTKRLTNIKTFAGITLSDVRDYRVHYEPSLSPSTNRSRLANIEECGFGVVWECKPATTFGWQQVGNGWGGAGYSMPGALISYNADYQEIQAGQLVDVNGDGLVDVVRAWDSSSGASVRDVWLNTGHGWVGAGYSMPGALVAYNGFQSIHPGQLVDVNGDGLVDVVRAWDSSSGASARDVWLNTGHGWVGAGYSMPGALVTYDANYQSVQVGQLVDINGDGLVDVVRAWDSSSGASVRDVWLNTGHGWVGAGYSMPGALVAYNGFQSFHPGQLVDVNGDGLVDVVRAWDSSSGASVRDVWLNTGHGWVGAGYSMPGALVAYNGFQSIHPGQLVDVNGDGLVDLVRAWDSSSGASVRDVWLNTGHGWDSAGYSMPGALISYNADYQEIQAGQLVDVNGDGLVDVVRAWDSSSGASVRDVWLNTGHGWVGAGYSMPGALVAYNGFQSIHPGQLVDVNGDGLVDLVRAWDSSSGASVRDVWLNRGPFPDLLTNITNGLGNSTLLTYKPITDNTIYTKGADPSDDSPENHSGHPEFDYQGPMYVVSAVSSDNGIGGTNITSYSYGGARIHREGRGFLGFRWMNVANVVDAQAINAKTYFKQDYPYTGQADYSETILNGVTLKYTDNTWAVRASDNFVYLSETVDTSRELNGSFISKVRTQYSDYGIYTLPSGAEPNFDSAPYTQYGNPERIVVATNTGNDDTYEYVTTTINTYKPADLTNWIVGQLQRAEAANQLPGETAATARVSTFEYYTTGATNGLLKAEIIEPDNTNLKLRTEYAYDTYGNRTSTTLSGNTGATYPITTRATSVLFSNVDAINPTTVTTNALSQTETKVFDARYGVPTSLTGPNGLVTSWDYDAFGRKILETRADTNTTTWTYAWCDTSCPTNAVYKVTNTTSGSAPVTVFYDKLGREVQSQTTGFNSATVYKDTVYDTFGRVDKVSSPYFASATKYWTSFTYDVLGRVRTQTTPDNTVTESQYDGLHTTVYADRNGKNQRTDQWKNVLGQLIQVQDALLNSTYYVYDAYGNLDKVTDAAGNITNMDYDIRGNKTAMDDPDMGHWEYKYDALGLLRWQKNAKLQTTTMTYDTLNRLKTRVEAEGTSQWTYDTATGKGKGKIKQVTGPNSYNRVHVYDSLGREITVTTTISAVNYVVSYAYDSKSRVDTVTYPMGVSSRFAIRNIYDTNGYLKEVQNASNSSVYYWKAVGINAAGQVTWETAGNNLDTLNTYNPLTGRLEAISTASGSVQSLGFGYDSLGNLKTRTDSNQGLTESFTYDALNRLDTAQIAGYGVKDYDYNAIGNIMSKSDYATTYVYGTKPHAVTSVKNGTTTVATYAYDSNGNMTSGAGRTIGYSSYNKPTTITQGTKYSNFQYGPDRTRTVQTSSSSSGTSTTIYINPGVDSGVYFEKETKGGVTSYTNYIYGGSGLIGTYTTRSNSTQSTRYFHKDHLGSIDVITNETGAVVERLSYDAFGQRRMALCGPSNPVCVSISAVTRHGFTNHEHLDEVSLIHMNGRVYDPRLGRFLSADPTIQYAASTQGLNRYSYTDNNPLSRVDMDGFNWISKKWRQARKDIKKYGSTIVSVGFGMVGAPFIGSMLSGAINIANGGSLREFAVGMMAGGIAGVLTGPVAGSISQSFGLAARNLGTAVIRGALAGGVSGAITAVYYGTSINDGFRQGMLAGTATSAAIWGGRAYRTNSFIDNNLNCGSDGCTNTQLNAIRDAGQSAIGQEMMGHYLGNKGTLYVLPEGSSPYINATGPHALPGTNLMWFDGNVQSRIGSMVSSEPWGASMDDATTFIHEAAHADPAWGVPDPAEYYRSTFRPDSVSTTENPYRAWMGNPLRTDYALIHQGATRRPVYGFY